MQSNRKVAKAGLLMAAAAAFCRIVSVGKEVFVAFVFGAGIVTDAYALALLIPALGMSLFVNSVRRALLVQYPRFEAQGPVAAENCINQFLTGLLVTSAALAALASGTLPFCWSYVIAADDPAVLRASTQLIVPAAWMIVPIAAIAGLTAVLNAKQQFSRPQLTAVLPTISVVLAVLVGGRSWGARGLIGGLFVGSVIQSVVLAAMLSRAGHRLRWHLDRHSPVTTILWRFALPLILLDMVSQSNVFVDRAMASWLDPGKVAVLTWAASVKDFLSGTLIASLLVVLLPHFSQQVARGATDELRRSCSLILRYAGILLFPLSALLALCCPPVFPYLAFGELDASATAAIASCLIAYGVGLFADLASTSLYQALLALGRLRTLLILSVTVNFLPNLAFNLLLIRPLGEAGLALSTSLVGYTTLLANYLVLRASVGMHEERRALRIVLGSAAASGAMLALGHAIQHTAVTWSPDDTSVELAGVAVSALAAIALYAGLMLVFPGSPDARLATRMIRDRVSLTAAQLSRRSAT